jgi:DNA-binding response OmpR family regulator
VNLMTSILVVDGHPTTRAVRSRVLSEAGYHVTQARSARAAIDSLLPDNARVALALIEVGLPDCDGFDLCQQIKASRPELPVILISADYRSSQARRDGFSAGADAYLVEPMPATRLVDTVRQLLSADDAGVPPPGGVVRTTQSGCILWVNHVAARLLNIGERAAPGRNLLTFFNGNRHHLQQEIMRAAGGQVCELEASLRPRERKPFDLRIDLSRPSDGQPGELEWLIAPVDRDTPDAEAAGNR